MPRQQEIRNATKDQRRECEQHHPRRVWQQDRRWNDGSEEDDDVRNTVEKAEAHHRPDGATLSDPRRRTRHLERLAAKQASGWRSSWRRTRW